MTDSAESDFVVSVFRAGFLPTPYWVLALDANRLLARTPRDSLVRQCEQSNEDFGWYIPEEGSLLRTGGDDVAVMKFGSALPTRGPWAVFARAQPTVALGAFDLSGLGSVVLQSYGRACAVRLMVLSRAQALATALGDTFYGHDRQAVRPHIEALIALGDRVDLRRAVSEAVHYLTDLGPGPSGRLGDLAGIAGENVFQHVVD